MWLNTLNAEFKKKGHDRAPFEVNVRFRCYKETITYTL